MAPSNVRVISRFIDLIETVGRTASLRSLVLTDSKAFSRHRKLSFNTVTYLILNLLKKSLQVELKLFFSQLQIPVEQQFTKGVFPNDAIKYIAAGLSIYWSI
jgi:hypothetical protein